jgi:beta-lactamase class A
VNTNELEQKLKKNKIFIYVIAALVVISFICNALLLYYTYSSSSKEETEVTPSLLAQFNTDTDNYLYQDLVPTLSEYITSHGNTYETWAFAVIDVETGKMASWNSHPMVSASIIKQFIMGAVYDHYDELLQNYDESDLITDLNGMITRSDNTCANNLIYRLGSDDYGAGVEVVNEFASRNGYSETRLDHPFYLSDDDEEAQDNMTSAVDNATFQYDLLQGRYAHSEDMLNLLKGSKITHKIPGAVPSNVQTANKTGDLWFVENDCAIIWAENGTYILSIMSLDISSNTAAQSVIRGVSSIVYDYFSTLDRSSLNVQTSDQSAEIEESFDDAEITEDGQ